LHSSRTRCPCLCCACVLLVSFSPVSLSECQCNASAAAGEGGWPAAAGGEEVLNSLCMVTAPCSQRWWPTSRPGRLVPPPPRPPAAAVCLDAAAGPCPCSLWLEPCRGCRPPSRTFGSGGCWPAAAARGREAAARAGVAAGVGRAAGAAGSDAVGRAVAAVCSGRSGGGDVWYNQLSCAVYKSSLPSSCSGGSTHLHAPCCMQHPTNPRALHHGGWQPPLLAPAATSMLLLRPASEQKPAMAAAAGARAQSRHLVSEPGWW